MPRQPLAAVSLHFVCPALTLSPSIITTTSEVIMKIHEYQAKELLRRFDVKVPRGRVARSIAEAEEAAKELGLPVVVKAQIHAGGRGKGGGVKLARTSEDVHNLVKQMIGMNLVTHQTGPEGRAVHTLLIEEGLKIKQEFYL